MAYKDPPPFGSAIQSWNIRSSALNLDSYEFAMFTFATFDALAMRKNRAAAAEEALTLVKTMLSVRSPSEQCLEPLLVGDDHIPSWE